MGKKMELNKMRSTFILVLLSAKGILKNVRLRGRGEKRVIS